MNTLATTNYSHLVSCSRNTPGQLTPMVYSYHNREHMMPTILLFVSAGTVDSAAPGAVITRVDMCVAAENLFAVSGRQRD